MTTTLDAGPEPSVRRPPAPEEPRLLSGRPDLPSHLDRVGPLPPWGRDLIAELDRAGLAGRGGASFPTARKMAAVAAGPGPRVVVANGTEGEPLSAKDKTLLLQAPHLVLDGLDLAARAVGARRRIICVEREHPDVYRAVRAAMAERADDTLELVRTPHRYVTGQETALVDLIDGGPGRPSLSRPFERGVGGAPTLVDNVETLAHMALIARFGAGWYRSAGTEDDPGTTLVTLAGAVREPGVREVDHGESLPRLLRDARSAAPRGVLVGGYYGRWLPGSALTGLTLDRAGLARHGASLGAGVIAVIDESSCVVAELARVAAWYAASSAGQCGACTWGLRDLAGATAAIQLGRRADRARSDIGRWAPMVKGRGACRLPDGAAGFLESGIEVFADEIAAHESGGGCGRPDNHLLPAPAQEAW